MRNAWQVFHIKKAQDLFQVWQAPVTDGIRDFNEVTHNAVLFCRRVDVWPIYQGRKILFRQLSGSNLGFLSWRATSLSENPIPNLFSPALTAACHTAVQAWMRINIRVCILSGTRQVNTFPSFHCLIWLKLKNATLFSLHFEGYKVNISSQYLNMTQLLIFSREVRRIMMWLCLFLLSVATYHTPFGQSSTVQAVTGNKPGCYITKEHTWLFSLIPSTSTAFNSLSRVVTE